MKKRVLSILAVLALVFGMLPGAALAAAPDTNAGIWDYVNATFGGGDNAVNTGFVAYDSTGTNPLTSQYAAENPTIPYAMTWAFTDTTTDSGYRALDIYPTQAGQTVYLKSTLKAGDAAKLYYFYAPTNNKVNTSGRVAGITLESSTIGDFSTAVNSTSVANAASGDTAALNLTGFAETRSARTYGYVVVCDTDGKVLAYANFAVIPTIANINSVGLGGYLRVEYSDGIVNHGAGDRDETIYSATVCDVGDELGATAVPNPGYKVKSVTINGDDEDLSGYTSGTYKFYEMIAIAFDEECYFVVEFEPIGAAIAVPNKHIEITGDVATELDDALYGTSIDSSDVADVLEATEAVFDEADIEAVVAAAEIDISSYLATLKAFDAFKDLDPELSVNDLVVVVQTYLDIEVTGYENDVLTLNITPRYKLLVTSQGILANVLDDPFSNSFVTATGATQNAIEIAVADDTLPVKGTTVVTVTLPGDLADVMGIDSDSADVLIRHKTESGAIEYYEPDSIDTSPEPNKITFENPHGFSEFSILADDGTVVVSYRDETGDVDADFNGAHANPATYTELDIGINLPTYAPAGYTFNGWQFYADDGEGDPIIAGGPFKGTLTQALFDAIADEESGRVMAKPVLTPIPTGPSGSSNFTITAEAGADGAVSPETASVKKGDDHVVTITPKAGYVINTVMVDNVDVTAQVANGKYTFKDVQANHELKASFKLAFGDVNPGKWPYDEIKYVFDNSLMEGDAGLFRPNAAATRGMMVTILWRMEGSPVPTITNPFTDLKQDWYKNAVIWAAEKGIVEGYGGGLFGPEDTVTRQDMVTIFYNFAKYKSYNVAAANDLAAFMDAKDISGYALAPMRWAVETGLIEGRSATILAPKGTSTRAELATVIMRFIEKNK